MKTYSFYVGALCVALVGCSEAPKTEQKTEQKTTSTTSDTAPSSLPDNAPTIRVATTGLEAPSTYKDEKGVIVGIDIDVIQAIGEKEGFKIQVVPVSWDRIFEDTHTGVYDVALSTISWTPERAGKYSLTDAYFFNPATFAYKPQAGFAPKTLADLKDKKVAVVAGTKHEQLAKTAGITQIVTTNNAGFETFAKLAKGEVDAYLHDNLNVRSQQASYPDLNFTMEQIETESEKTAGLVMVVAKDKPELLAKINQGLAKIKAEGKIEQIVEKHMTLIKNKEKQ